MQLRMGHGRKYSEVESKPARAGVAVSGIRFLLTLIIIMAAISWAIPTYAATQKLDSVRIVNMQDCVQITVHGSQSISLHTSRIQDRYLVFDLRGSLVANQQKKLTVNSGGITVVKCGWFKDKPPVARIAVSTSGHRTFSIQRTNNGRVAIITIDKAGRAVAKQSKPAVSQAKPVAAATAEPQPVIEPVEADSASACTPVSTISRPEPEVKAVEAPVLVASAEPIAVPMMTAQPAAAIGQADKRITLDFVGSDIHDVLKALSAQSGVNVVASPDVKGELTVALNDVTVDEALRLVANLSGYKFAKSDGAYVVGTADNLKALAAGGSASAGAGDEKITEVTIIKYADGNLITKMLEAQFGMVKVSSNSAAEGKEGAKKENTVIVLTGPKADVIAAKAFVDKVESSLSDKVAAMVTELYEVKYADVTETANALMASVPGLQVSVAPNQGFNLLCPTSLKMGNAEAASGSGANAQKAQSKTLILQGTAQEIENAKLFLAKVDTQQPQIVIEAKIVDLTNDAAKDLGIEWSWPGNGDTPGNIKLSETRYAPDLKPASVNALGSFRRVQTEIFSKINAQIKNGKAKVLANPNIAALDGKPASIFIGDEVKYVVNVQQTQTGVNVTVETAMVGVQLHTISRINPDGYITMNLHPEVSMITDWLITDDVSLPEISRRFVDSTIRVKNGETIAIGGLIKDEEIEKASGIPFLKDLPILGALFRSKSTTKQHSEVVMFITPRILTAN